VIAGTRVPVRTIECPEAGERLEDVLDEHPTVAREQAVCWSGPRRSAAPCAWQWIRRAGRCRPRFEFRQDTSELPVAATFMIVDRDRSRVQDFHALVPGVVEVLSGHLRRRIRPVRV